MNDDQKYKRLTFECSSAPYNPDLLVEESINIIEHDLSSSKKPVSIIKRPSSE